MYKETKKLKLQILVYQILFRILYLDIFMYIFLFDYFLSIIFLMNAKINIFLNE